MAHKTVGRQLSSSYMSSQSGFRAVNMELSGTPGMFQFCHLTRFILVGLQVKPTGTLPDSQAPGLPIEASSLRLVSVWAQESHFASTQMMNER